KIESLKVTVDFLKVPLGLKKPPLKEALAAVPGPGRAKPFSVERHKPRRSDTMDNESQYSGYSYKSGHSRSSRKHRDRRDRHRSKSRDGSRGDKSVTIQAPGEPLLDNESTRGDERDDNWGETTTVVTGTSEHSISHDDITRITKDMEDSAHLDCSRHLGVALAGALALLAFLTPVAFMLLPQLLWREELEPCGTPCEGLFISVAFKLLILLLGSWALFFRRPKAFFPRVFVFRALLMVLVFLLVVSYWLFYGVRILDSRERNYQGVVQYAVSLVDALLFVHYLAVVLLELRQLQPQFTLKAVRSADGASRFYNVGHLRYGEGGTYIYAHTYICAQTCTYIYARTYVHTRTFMFTYIYAHTYICAHACTYIYAHTCVRTHAHSYLHTYMHIHTCVHTYARTYMRIHTYTHMHICARMCTHVHIHIGTYIYAHTYMRTHAHSYLHICTYIHTCTYMHIHICAYIHIGTYICDVHVSFPSSKAFLERYLTAGPTIQYHKDRWLAKQWTLVSEEPVTNGLKDGVVFVLKRQDFSLVVSTKKIPFFKLSEEFVDPKSHKFVMRLQSETSV
ncbi:VNG2A protein, partial [Nyctibius bracteatus]|nr:VNG2A protein [Nyctibius bracteatus]